MLHFYTYYSVGGYKDMYLGNSEMKEVAQTYYLPLLPSMKVKADAGDDVMKGKVTQLEALARIELLTKDDRKGLPTNADKLITHGGYRIIYTHLEGDKHIIVMRDIQGSNTDENGRAIPFLMSIMCDSASDLPLMNSIAAYIANNAKTVEEKFDSLLHYDVKVNGLCFELAKMCEWIAGLKNNKATIKTANLKSHAISASRNEIALAVASIGIKRDYLLNELSIEKQVVEFIPSEWLLPEDDKKRADEICEKWKLHKLEKRQKKIQTGVIVAVSALLVGGLILCLCHCGHSD